MNRRRWNWQLWAGFVLCLIALPSYFFVFSKFPVTRDVPWVNFLLFGTGIAFLFFGLKHAFSKPRQYRGRIAGSMLSLLSLSALGFFCFVVFYQTRQLPASDGAPRIGQRAPEFVLPDTNNKLVSLSSLLSTPLASSQATPTGVLLIFYRGYWCPFCNSELRGIEKHLTEFQQLGVRPVAISVDAPEVSRDLCQKAGYTYTFLSDSDAEVMRRYDLLHPGAGVNGHDIARPAEFLLDSTGVIRWMNLTGDVRVRARPERMMEAAKVLK